MEKEIKKILIQADGYLSLLRHRGNIKWGSVGLPEEQEVDEVIGKIRKITNNNKIMGEDKKVTKKYAEVRISFDLMNEKQREHLFNAESELHKAGVMFDTGYDFKESRRDWEFDYSLTGAKVELKKTLVPGANMSEDK